MKESKSADDEILQKKGNGKITIIAIIIIVLVLAIAFYIAKVNKVFNSKELFTQYHPLQVDTLIFEESREDSSNVLEENLDTLLPKNIDTLLASAPETTNNPPPKIEAERVSKPKLSIPSVRSNTIHESISNTVLFENQSNLLDEILIKKSKEGEYMEALLDAQKLSYKTVVDLLNLAGYSILSGEDRSIGEGILKALFASEEIEFIHVFNSKSKIVYSQNKDNTIIAVDELLAKFDFSDPSLQIKASEEITFLLVPIFHRYGLWGQVFMGISNSK